MRPADSLPTEFAEALAGLRPRLGDFGRDLIFYDTVGSTNDVVTEMALEGAHEGTVVIADTQTAGRGRRGRTWCSPAGSGLYVSLLLDPGRASRDPRRVTSLMTLAAGVALCDGVYEATGLRPDIKWPNDLLVGGRKLAGILAEGIASSPDGRSSVVAPQAAPAALRVVLGFGINVSPAAYPPDVARRATSLENELGRSVDRGLVCAHALAALADRYGDLMAGRFDAILDAWRRRASGSRGARVRWHDGTGHHSGITNGIDEAGALLVHEHDRIQRLVAGEVLWD